jgi:hypothetical protein
MRVQVQKDFTSKDGQQRRKGESIDLPDAEAREQIQNGNATNAQQQSGSRQE